MKYLAQSVFVKRIMLLWVALFVFETTGCVTAFSADETEEEADTSFRTSRPSSSSSEEEGAADSKSSEKTSVKGSFQSASASKGQESEEAREEVTEESEPPPSLGLDEKVSIDLRNIDVNDALRFIAQKGALNMAISKSVTGRVQLLLNNIPIRDILDLILITNGLAFDKVGEVYNIITEAEYKERYGRKFSDSRQVRTFKLKYAIPEQAFAVFEVLKSEIGRLLVDPDSGTVLVMDAPMNIARMEAALQSLEQKKSIKVYSLKYAKAADIETRLKSRLDSKKVGTITADERTNQVIVESLPDRIKEIDEMIVALDQKTREVLIEAKIIKLNLTDAMTKELKWEGIFTRYGNVGQNFIGNHGLFNLARNGTSFLDDHVNIALSARPSPGVKNHLTENLVFGFLDNDDGFEALLNYMQTLGETRVLSNPKLAVVNNQEAKIHVGEKQAYVTTTTTTGTQTTTTAESVTFVDIGIQLSVTPTINEDGFVTMKIKPEISSVSEFLTTPSGNRIPIIDSSLAETTVMVKDGISIMIGGLRKDEKTETKRRVPFMADLPLFGHLFKSDISETVHTELLVILTPHVIYGDVLVTGAQRAADSPLLGYGDYAFAKTQVKT